jgi:histidine ammonia-lyase
MTRDLTDKVWKLAAIQALALAQAADLRGDVVGERYAQLHGLVRSTSEKLADDRPLFEDIARVRDRLQSSEAQSKLLPPRPPAP